MPADIPWRPALKNDICAERLLVNRTNLITKEGRAWLKCRWKSVLVMGREMGFTSLLHYPPAMIAKLKIRCALTPVFIAASLLISAPSTRATTIAAVVTPENIVIAADSLVTKVSDAGSEGIGFAQKIEAFGPTVVAAGGLAKAGNKLFDVFDVVSQSCLHSSGADGQAQAFASLMRMKLPALVAGLRQQSAKNQKGLPPMLNSTVWFCGLEETHPVIYAVESEIGLGVESQSRVSIQRYPPYASRRAGGVVFMGPSSLRGRQFELDPRRFREIPYLVRAADEVVRAGIADPRGRSGGAVTIVHISKNRAHLISSS